MATDFYTFWKLLNDPDVKQIQVPIIQRDYAQGRRDEKATLIRTRFVEALYNAVHDQKPLVLDFVYGELEGGVFVPLDGQQRLTTLFLLHWYLAMAEGRLTEAQPVLRKFTYETRINSRDFCRELVSAKAPDRSKFARLSQAIEDTNWFQPAWKRDPTVAAMLTMLDALEQRFGSPTGWFDRLKDDSHPLIGFYFLNMPETGLSDDLYLKMNARGKALTDFENWKAEFDLFLQRQYPSDSDLPDIHRKFGQKLDGPWTDFFWNYRKEGSAEIDKALEQYLHYVTRMLAYQHSAAGESFGDLTKEKLPFACFEQVYSRAEAVRFLFNSLDFLASAGRQPEGIGGLLGRLLSEQPAPDRVRLFGERVNLVEQCVQGRLSRQEEVLLFVLLSLANANGGQLSNEEDARDLLRVVRNLLERVRQQNDTKLNSNLRASDLPAFAQAVAILTGSTTNVYEQLEEGLMLPDLSEHSVEHEREKAVLLLTRQDLKPVVHALEDKAVLRGDLHNLRLPEHSTDDIVRFARAMAELWPESSPLPQELLIRAWLTRGDYSITQWRWTQLGHRHFFGNERDWYTILATDQNKRSENLLTEFLLAYDATEGIEPNQKLHHLVNQWLDENSNANCWQYYFIKYPEMTKKSTGYYAWANDSDFQVRLLKSVDLRGRHINPFVRTIILRGKVADAIQDEGHEGVNGNNESPLYLCDIAGTPSDAEQPKLYCEDEGWRLELAPHCTLNDALMAAHGLQYIGASQWLLAPTRDRIEQAEELIADLYHQGVIYEEPETEEKPDQREPVSLQAS